MPNNLAVFQGKSIRKTFYQEEWWFAVVDICAVLAESKDSQAYWRKLKQRMKEEGDQSVTFCHALKLPAADGKMRKIDCANTEGCFRIIQSIPSPTAEPFKRWLAKVGYERIQEIEDPELAMQRMRNTYIEKGYSEEWIEKRIRGMEVRKNLTEEWDNRGIKEQRDYAILTAEIRKAAFGMTPDQYKKHKGLNKPSENLRDHMTDLELIFTMLGEASTMEIARTKDAQGFPENKKASREGGAVAGNARDELEQRSGRMVVSKKNYKEIPEKEMRKELE